MYLDKLVAELKRQVNKYKYVDVGVGAEDIYCVSRERFNHAIRRLQNEGYFVVTIELNNGEQPFGFCMAKILSASPISQKDINDHREQWTIERRAIMDAKLSHDTHRNIFKYHMLDSFNPKVYEDRNLVMEKIDRGSELAFCSSLITKMCFRGATDEELADVIKYSMVVLDADRHTLNWKKAAEDFKVREMAEKYMPKTAP